MKFLITSLVAGFISLNCFGMTHEDVTKIKENYVGIYDNLQKAGAIFINSAQLRAKKKSPISAKKLNEQQAKYEQLFQCVDTSMKTAYLENGIIKIDIKPIKTWEEIYIKNLLGKKIKNLEEENTNLQSQLGYFQKGYAESEYPDVSRNSSMQRTSERPLNNNENFRTAKRKNFENPNEKIETLDKQIKTKDLEITDLKNEKKSLEILINSMNKDIEVYKEKKSALSKENARITKQRNWLCFGFGSTLAAIGGWFAYNHLKK